MTGNIYIRSLGSILGGLILAVQNCQKTRNEEWEVRHVERATKLVEDHLPSGAGFDSGSHLDWDSSTDEKLVFFTSFHHLDENGAYDGWTEHKVIVKPSLWNDLLIEVTGPDKNDILDYIGDAFSMALRQRIDQLNGDVVAREGSNVSVA